MQDDIRQWLLESAENYYNTVDPEARTNPASGLFELYRKDKNGVLDSVSDTEGILISLVLDILNKDNLKLR